MACYSPLKGWRATQPEKSGKYKIVFSPSQGFTDLPMEVPCGQCIGCRLDRSKAWAIRCVHEAQLHKNNCFITLTYNDENLPENESLHYPDFQRFMKRLRKKYGDGIRFFYAGEYGSKLGRPHYHAILFNHDFDDRYFWQTTPSGSRLDRSPSLESLWPFGYSSVGECTFESAAYVARYIMKKVTGKNAPDYYGDKVPEHTNMSRRPGIASGWFEKYGTDVYPSDEVIHKGRRLKPPRYYDGLYEIIDPEGHADVKLQRKRRALRRRDENTPDRLAAREAVKKAQTQSLKRKLS